MRNPHAGKPFTAAQFSDEQIAAMVEDLSVPTLLLSCVHLSPPGDRRRILDGPIRPTGSYINEYQGFLTDEQQAEGRALAVELICAWRDRGCPEPEPLSAGELEEMMDWMVGAPVDRDYVAMMAEELGLEGDDARATGEVEGAADVPVVIIGAGMSGLLAAIRLDQAGFPYVIVEKNDGPGGTWWENTYPGARVDVGSHFYCYSFEPSHHWTEFFARQPELARYFADVMDRYGVTEHVRFGVEVTRAVWDEDAATWHVHLDDGSVVDGRAVICAVGQLNRPFVPDVPGTFDGPSFHTARWDHDVDVAGKDVVMVGAGATGFQLAPAIAEEVRSLTVVQRTAQWMFPNPGYREAVGPGVPWAIEHLPFYGRWFRFLIYFPSCDGGLVAAKVDPDWPHQERSVSEVNDIARELFTDWITSQVDGDPELVAKVVPTYPPTGKRTLQDDGSWLRTLTRDNVELVRAGVDHLEADAVVDSNGDRHHADVLVWATGFRPNEMLVPMEIVGRDGVDLREHWGTRPRALYGITVAGFPNFFMMYGPATNLASGGSIIAASEAAMTYIDACLRLLVEGGHTTMAPTVAAYDDWYERTQAEIRTMVWASPHIEHNYYRNADGEVHTLNPFRFVDYWRWTRTVDENDYVFT
ncbi:MAG: NAD(P)/FAD-dependent oxidoreductase [Actinobacteria bacterium]|nr:NAD(P)/FAD-dependent oxidoreductase [Actinomycetota bacterium]